jgi:hypothetical protein
VDAGAVLGVPSLRAPFLDDISAAEPRAAQAARAGRVTIAEIPMTHLHGELVLQDDDDDDEDDDDLDDLDDGFGDDDLDESEDDEDEDEDVEEDEESGWQVSAGGLIP